jgi:hypothetical protein
MTRARSNRCLVYAASLLLLAIGSLTAHSLAYRAVAPDGEAHALLEQSGHGYLFYAHLGLALCVTAVLVALVLVVVGAKGRTSSDVPVWLFGLVPALGFAVQEHVERLVVTGEIPAAVVLEPTFAIGLLLQLAFALLAAMLVRALLAVGEAIGKALAGRRRPLAASSASFESTSKVTVPPSSILALGHAQRAPPLNPSFG